MTLCDAIAREIGELFTCSVQGDYVRIRTPFMYPDGDMVDLFVAQDAGDGPWTLTDLGETVRWLRMQTGTARRSPKQRQMIDDVCLTQGAEFFRGMLVARVDRRERLPTTLVRLAQAAVRVSDIWFTTRTRAIESASDEVADFLDEHQIAFERGKKLGGRSGRWWTVDFHTHTPARSALTYVLSTGNRASARGVVEHVVAAWYDLSHLAVGPQAMSFVSLFDDTVDVWTEEDFRQLAPLSELARWSQPDEFARVLSAA